MAPITTLPPAENAPPAGGATTADNPLVLSATTAENPPPSTLTENLPWTPSQEIKELRQQMDHFETLLSVVGPSERTPLFQQWVALGTRLGHLGVVGAPAKNQAIAKKETAKTTEETAAKRQLCVSKFREIFRVLQSQRKALERMQAEVERLQIIYYTAVQEGIISIQSDHDRLLQAYDNLHRQEQEFRAAEAEYMAA